MAYAILQQSLDPTPTAEQLERAFAAVRSLTKHDAAAQAKDAYGILATALTSWDAAALQKALYAEGVETLVAEESTLPVLPPPKTLTRADPLSDALVLYDALGRPQRAEWGEVALISAGSVALVKFERTRKDVVVGHLGRGAPVVVRDLEVHEKRQPTLLAEIFLAGGASRYRILPRQFNYGYLGLRVSRRATDNFLTLLGDLLRLAPAAARNRGAALLAGDPPQTLAYPSRHAFEEEMTWCLWMKGKGV